MKQNNSSTITILTILAVSAATRVFHVIPNMAPITALAVFGAWTFRDSRLAYLVPLLAMVLGDIALAIVHGDIGYAWHNTQAFVYVCILATSFISLRLSTRNNIHSRIASVISGSVLFYIVTNFAVWMTSSMYAPTVSGLTECYVAAIPFFRNSLVADSVYAVLMFGAYEMAMRRTTPVRVHN